MRRLIALSLLSFAAVSAAPVSAEAQTLRRRGEDVIIFRVQPRSYLDAGKVVPVGSLNRYASSQAQSYLVLPPWQNMRDRFGEGSLPDPIGIMPGARRPFDPVDFNGPIDVSRY